MMEGGGVVGGGVEGGGVAGGVRRKRDMKGGNGSKISVALAKWMLNATPQCK